MERSEVLHQEIDRYLEKYDDTTTLCAEMLDGNMESEFEFTPIGDELYGRDGRAFGPIFDKSIVDAKRAALKNPELKFEIPRNYTERDERDLIYAMVRRELPNTMVVESDYPMALQNATKDVGGYNVVRKQTFQRVITLRPDGKIHIVSQSLDRSDRDGLEAIYAYFGKKPQPGELLGQRIHVDLSPEEQETLNAKLKGIYDRKLSEKFGGTWHAGRQPIDYRNTYDFVRQQHDLVDMYVMKSLQFGEDESMLYGLAAALRERFKASGKKNFVPLSAIRANGDIFMEMYLAGQKAKSEGWVATGCGMTIGQDGKPVSSIDGSIQDQFEELGYGRGSQEEDQYGSLTFECQKGHKNTRERGKLLERCKTCNCDLRCGPEPTNKETTVEKSEKTDYIKLLLAQINKEKDDRESEFTLAA